jgi:hypothetical protein
LLKRNDLALAIRDRKVEKEQQKNYRVKDNPEAYGHEFSACARRFHPSER